MAGVTSTADNVGGICGLNYGTITSCKNKSEVKGKSYVSGIAGVTYGCIKKCCNLKAIEGSTHAAGITGLVATEASNISIEECYNNADINSLDHPSYDSYTHAGGIAGQFEATNSTIQNCYNTGYINGNGRGQVRRNSWSYLGI